MQYIYETRQADEAVHVWTLMQPSAVLMLIVFTHLNSTLILAEKCA